MENLVVQEHHSRFQHPGIMALEIMALDSSPIDY
jgi:hypothetical protein